MSETVPRFLLKEAFPQLAERLGASTPFREEPLEPRQKTPTPFREAVKQQLGKGNNVLKVVK
jgi:hypothetical protein